MLSSRRPLKYQPLSNHVGGVELGVGAVGTPPRPAAALAADLLLARRERLSSAIASRLGSRSPLAARSWWRNVARRCRGAQRTGGRDQCGDLGVGVGTRHPKDRPAPIVCTREDGTGPPKTREACRSRRWPASRHPRQHPGRSSPPRCVRNAWSRLRVTYAHAPSKNGRRTDTTAHDVT